MTMPPTAAHSAFRVDRFDVPLEALGPFLARLQATQHQLGELEGCLQNLVLQGPEGGETIALVTIVEWSSERAMAAAKAAMQAHLAHEDFEPATFMRELRVRPDMAVYRAV